MNARELAAALFRILETGDPLLAAEVVAADNRNREAAVAPSACAIPGPAGTLASGAWMRSAFSELRFPILGFAEGGDQVWVRLRMQGRHTGPFVRFRDGRLAQAIPPTGREIDFEQVHMVQIRDGRVAGHEAVRDDMTMLAQLGVFPPAPAAALRMVAWRVSGRASRAAAEVSALAAGAAQQLDKVAAQDQPAKSLEAYGYLRLRSPGERRGGPVPRGPDVRSGTYYYYVVAVLQDTFNPGRPSWF